jgi:lipopolysaccharide/colanic/teichoic acid biosynthesis glycosyltransferase
MGAQRRAFEWHDGSGPAPVLDAGLFRAALVRERHRADRADRGFALLVVQPADRPWPAPDAVAGTLATAARATDLTGWLERGRALGVIVPEIPPSDVGTSCDRVEARFRRMLARALDPATARGVAVERHLYPEPRRAGGERAWRPDPALHPEWSEGRSARTAYDLAKRALDVAGSAALLLLLSPFLLLVALCVKLDSRGPVMFRQVRIGQMLVPFTILKFRTMHARADHRIHQEFVDAFIRSSASGGGGQLFKLTADPRVTRVGRVLRSTSVDELPQLWNVLRGEMSLVGPRPPIPYELDRYNAWHVRRVLEAKPGLTGLWQVVGRSRTTFDEMVRLDLRYARTRSLWGDFKILLATPRAVVSRRGAC